MLPQLWVYTCAISGIWWTLFGSVLLLPEVIKLLGGEAGRTFLRRIHWKLQYSLFLAIVLLFAAQFSAFRDLLSHKQQELDSWRTKENELRADIANRDSQIKQVSSDLNEERRRAEALSQTLSDERAARTDSLEKNVSVLVTSLARWNPGVESLASLSKPGSKAQFTTVNSGDMVEGRIRSVYVKLKVLYVSSMGWGFKVEKYEAKWGNVTSSGNLGLIDVPLGAPAGIIEGGGCTLVATAIPTGEGHFIPLLASIRDNHQIGAAMSVGVSVCPDGK